MSFEEKSAWIMALVTPGSCLVYLWILMPRLQHADVSAVAYEWPLVGAVVFAIVASIVVHVLVAVLTRADVDLADERDRRFGVLGGHVGSYVLAVGVCGALALALLRSEHFWIANALYGSLVCSDFASSVVKLVGYRRGL